MMKQGDMSNFQQQDTPFIKEENRFAYWNGAEEKIKKFFLKGMDNAMDLIYKKKEPEREPQLEGQFYGAIVTKQLKFIQDQDLHQLLDLYLDWGPRWTLFTQFFNQKSENNLKNKFYAIFRKFVRKINLVSKKLIPKYPKDIKYQTISRILDVKDAALCLPPDMLQLSQSLRIQIIHYCKQGLPEDQPHQLVNFINRVRYFNVHTRCYRMNKKSSKRNSTLSNELSIYLKSKSFLGMQGEKICTINNNKNECFVSFMAKRQGIENELKTQEVCQLKEYDEDENIDLAINQEDKIEYEVSQIMGITFNPSQAIFMEYF